MNFWIDDPKRIEMVSKLQQQPPSYANNQKPLYESTGAALSIVNEE